jgi:uncharacterized protein YuzE
VRVVYDSEADAIAVHLRDPEGPVETEFVDDVRYVDYDAAGNVVGIELLAVSHGYDLAGLPEAERIAKAIKTIAAPLAG